MWCLTDHILSRDSSEVKSPYSFVNEHPRVALSVKWGTSVKKTNISDIYKAKLKSSDLTIEEAKKLGFEIIEKPKKLEDHFFDTPAFKIPYHDQKGKASGFYRIRYLTTTKKGFSRATDAKDRRYDQPASELPQLYIPKLLSKGTSWKRIFRDTGVALVFTEGELKAACACKHGIPCLALGGVWNFKSKKNGMFRLPIFSEIDFKGRTVFIVFDSDSVTNAQVLHAQYKFAEELSHLGALPLVVNIPKEGDKKHGIDDYIVEHGAKAFKLLITDESNHVEYNFVRELLRLNSEIAIVHRPVAVLHYESGQLLSRQDASMLYANSRMTEQVLKAPTKKELADDPDAKPSVDYKEVSTFDAWLKWEQRGEVWSPVYEPGQPQFVMVDDRRCFNTWRGWGCEPVKGDVSLWKWLLKQIFKNAEEEHIRWFEQWCAYPLQNPGVKMYSCPILFGQTKGTGKSLLGLTLKDIYGENGSEITDTQLEDERNVYAAEKQFVLANEVTGSDKRTMVGRLRNLITQHEVVINKKYQPDYVVRDTINYFFTSNHIDAVYMEDDERRFFVHEVLGPKLVDVDNAKVVAYDRWLKSGEAARAVFAHLLSVDLTGFDPTAPAPNTKSKHVMVAASRTEVEAWCFKLKEDPDTCLRSGGNIIPFGLFKCKDLIDIFAGDSPKKPYDKTMTNALRKAGFMKAAHDQSCPTKDGKINLWAIRDEGMALKSAAYVGAAYDKEREMSNKPKKFEKGGKK